jgi:hypothetical protein
MSYTESLAYLFVILIPAAVIGWRVADCLPWRLRPEGRMFFGPLLGLAIVLHLVVLLGWIGHGYRQPVCLVILAAPLIIALWGRRDLTTQIRNMPLIILFAVVTTAGLLYTVWRYGAMSPYNDTFTYLVQGQWLQTHGFTEPTMRSGYYPALTQVEHYQRLGLRMGASFMLGYVQSLVGAQWSYQVYPAVIAIPMTLCALVVAASAFSICRRMTLSLLCGAAIGVTLNGFAFGAAQGFMPQTWGLTFAIGSLALAGQVLHRSIASSGTKLVRKHWIPVALLVSAAIFCYSEVAPFVIAAIALSLMAAAIPFRRRLRHLFGIAAWLGFLCALLVNLEWIRIVRAIPLEAHIVVGMAIDWPWWHFLWHAMGLRAGYWDGDLFLLGAPATGIASIVAVAIVIAGLRWSCRSRGKIWSLMPQLAFLAFAVAAFVYFRFLVPSPWPTGTGQSFSQFKLSKWATPFVFSLLALGVAAIARKSMTRSWILSVALAGILITGMVEHVYLANSRTYSLRQDTGMSYDPLSAFSKVHEFAASVPEDVPICLDLGDGLIKARQMLMYALLDHPVAGDWRTDGYLQALPVDQRNLPAEPCRWIISMDASPPPTARRAGNVWLSPCPNTFFALQSTTGGYGREVDQTGWWHWTARRLQFAYRIQGEQPQLAVVSFAYLAVSDHRPIHLSVGKSNFELILDAGWHDWKSPPIEIAHVGDTIEVAFDCNLPPVKLSEQDPREASYLIKNLVLRRVDHEVTNPQTNGPGLATASN